MLDPSCDHVEARLASTVRRSLTASENCCAETVTAGRNNAARKANPIPPRRTRRLLPDRRTRRGANMKGGMIEVACGGVKPRSVIQTLLGRLTSRARRAEVRSPSSPYSGERAGERGRRRLRSRTVGFADPRKSSSPPMLATPRHSPLPSFRSTGKRE